MTSRTLISLVGLCAVLAPFAVPAAAASGEDEAKFLAAVRTAFDDHKPDALSKLTCWDGVSDKEKKSTEKAYKALIEESVTFEIELVAPAGDSPGKPQPAKDAPRHPNLKITKRVDVKLYDKADNKILGIIGFPVGEKDGKLLFARETPEK